MRRALALLLLAVSAPVAFAEITISTITPAAGLVSGGEIVHIHGTNLGEPPVACAPLYCGLTVTFGATRATIIWDSVSEIIAIAPPHAAGAVDVVVQVAGSPAVTVANGFSYQDPKSDVVKLLLPIATSAAGAFNTSWQTDILAHNESTESLDVAGTTVPPLSTRRLALSPPSTGTFVELPRRVFENITVTTHVHDLVHDADTLGVDVPSIPETQFRRSIDLPGIPNDTRYRVLLRVYGYGSNSAVNVWTYDDASGSLLEEKTVTMAGSVPAYVQLPVGGQPGAARVRVGVTTANANDPPIWGFITLTNNVTESVTTITPSIRIAPTAPAQTLTQGHWGHAGYCMTVQSQSVDLHYSCSGGTFPLPVVGADGHFEVDGLFSSSSGPLPPFPPPSPAAHYSGVLSGTNLTLTIRLESGGTVGPLLLQFGSTDPCNTGGCP